MLNTFRKYFSVGLLNTALHWSIFSILYTFGLSQAISNFCAFAVAVTISFFVNAFYTFQQKATGKRYVLFVCFMGALSFFTGYSADHLNIIPLITMIIFSIISLIFGFIFSRYLVFRK